VYLISRDVSPALACQMPGATFTHGATGISAASVVGRAPRAGGGSVNAWEDNWSGWMPMASAAMTHAAQRSTRAMRVLAWGRGSDIVPDGNLEAQLFVLTCRLQCNVICMTV
jgi:hypothetical protein